MPTSKWLNHYLSRIKPFYRFHIRSNGVWADDSHLTTHFWQVDEVELCRQVTAKIGREPALEWANQITQHEDGCWQIVEEKLAVADFDGAYMADLLSMLPADCGLFLGNSLPVRHADQFGRPNRRTIRSYGNRGASGIDGNLSTALGIAAASSQPTVAVVGDITFFHDSNALEAGSRLNAPLTIVLMNNSGGGIFQRLPIKDLDPPFTSLFLTPHQIDFGKLAAAHGIDYARANDRAQFAALVRDSLGQPGTTIIEVQTNSQHDETTRQQIIDSVLDL
jgi:2-succinyl-5-enolpyruvyl-6-hydroxy-3-cyclohexene-1-carboxylate synthase